MTKGQPGDLIFALDIGTSSLKTALFDAEGNRFVKTTAHQPYSLRVAPDGTAELAVGDLERAALRAFRATLLARKNSRALRGRPIVAVATACFWHSLLGYDARRGQTTPIYTWADSRCREEARRLRDRLNERSYHARTGCMLRAPYWPAKLRWLQRSGVARGVTAWMSPAEWLHRRMTGSSSMSVSMASGTGLLDLRTNQWDDSLLHLLRISPRRLGAISDQPHLAAENPEMAMLHRFPELKDALWHPAIGDGAASNIGSDAIAPGVAALNIGTSAALRLVVAGVPGKIPAGLFCHRVDRDRCVLGGAISNAGNLRAWALRQLRLPDEPAALERALARRDRPVEGLRVLPFWSAERSPSWPDSQGGAIDGLTYATTSLDLLQALLEAPYHQLAQIADLLMPQGGRPVDIIVSGGIRNSPPALQRLANVLGRPVRPGQEVEATLRGAVLQVITPYGANIGLLGKGKAVRPQSAAVRLYAEARAAQLDLQGRLT